MMEATVLNLAELRRTNVVRCEKAFHKSVDEWSPERWALAMCGEAGEVANAVKKLIRGDGSVEAIADEIADVIIYGDLLAARLGIDLSAAVVKKFNEVSDRRGCDVKLKVGGESDHEREIAGLKVRSLIRRALPSPAAVGLGGAYWGLVAEVFALGSTSAIALCREMGRDPDTGKALESVKSV